MSAHMMTAMRSRATRPFPRSRQLAAMCAIAVVLILLGERIGTGHIGPMVIVSLLAVVGSLVLPWYLPELSLVVLGFAGRFVVPPFANAIYDVAFWTAIGLLVAFLARERRSLHLRLHVVGVILLGLVTVVAVSLIPTMHLLYAQEKTFRVVFYAIAFFLLAQAFLSRSDQIQAFLISLVLFVDAWALVSIALSLQAHGLAGIQRIAPPGGGPITLARLIGFAAIACIGLWYFHPRRTLFAVNALALTAAAFATGSRAPALVLVLLLMAFPMLCSLNRLSRRNSRRIMVGGVGIGILSIPLMRYAIDRELPFAMRFALIFNDDKGVSVRLREDDIAMGLTLARDNDWMGYGIGSWPVLNGMGDVQAYPHNLFIEMLVEQGGIGLLVLLAFIVSVVFTAVRALRRVEDGTLAAMIAVALSSFMYAVLVAQTSGDLYDNRYIWFYAAMVVTTSRLSWAATTLTPDQQGVTQVPGTVVRIER